MDAKIDHDGRSDPPHAVISGAGIAGLANADQLARRGWRVTVIEAAAAPRTGGYLIDFFGVAWPAARRLGLMEELQRYARHYTTCRIADAEGTTLARVRLDTVRDAMGGEYFSIARADIERVLRQTRSPGVEIRYGHRITALRHRADGVTATVDDGTEIEADLVLGADGVRSGVRRLLGHADADVVTDLGFVYAAATVTDPVLARRIGDGIEISDAVDIQVLVYSDLEDGPGEGTRPLTVFVVARDDGEAAARPVAWLRSAIVRGSGIAGLADALPDEVHLGRVVQTRVPRWRSGRVLLVGDAAHAPSLLSGQGAGYALAGATHLAHALDQHDDLDEALSAYEDSLRPVVTAAQDRARQLVDSYVARSRFGLVVLRRPLQRMLRFGAVQRVLCMGLTLRADAAVAGSNR